MRLRLVRNLLLCAACAVICFAQAPPPTAAPVPGTPAIEAHDASSHSEHDRAALEIKAQEKQRILGVVPEFNTSNVQNAARLSPGQKFELAFKSATDPFAVLMAGIDAGLDQDEDSFPGYGEGATGYARRFGASYADSFDGAILGNAIFPILLHQDPRYFRKGTGRYITRLTYAMSTTFICKGDNGKWQPNASNLLGNLAAGGIATLYYPASDRGAGLVFERAVTVTAEGALGAIMYEFWPDISRKLHKQKRS